MRIPVVNSAAAFTATFRLHWLSADLKGTARNANAFIRRPLSLRDQSKQSLIEGVQTSKLVVFVPL